MITTWLLHNYHVHYYYIIIIHFYIGYYYVVLQIHYYILINHFQIIITSLLHHYCIIIAWLLQTENYVYNNNSIITCYAKSRPLLLHHILMGYMHAKMHTEKFTNLAIFSDIYLNPYHLVTD